MSFPSHSVEIILGNRRASLPLLRPALGPQMIDIRRLREEAGLWAYDPAFGATGACRSAITYVDGDNGLLFYRGYPIEELVARCDYLEVAFLLLEGELPSAAQKAEFAAGLAGSAAVGGPLPAIFRGFRHDAHPMAMLCAAAAGLAGLHGEGFDVFDPDERLRAAHRLVATMPVLAAMAWRHSLGRPCVAPRSDLGFAENFLSMLFAEPQTSYAPPPALAKALDALLIVQADHEQNASTTAMRLVGSTRADPYAATAAAIAALWGPLHGGANEAVLATLEAIGTKARIPEMLRRARDRSDPFRLSGFGHRVYKSYDPRARVLRPLCHEVLAALGRADPLLDLALELERIALDDDYFVSRRLYPNVDFYSGILFRALGLPPKMFTPVFAVARTAGWVAHWHEMMADPETRIVRPRQLYVGPTGRNLEPRS